MSGLEDFASLWLRIPFFWYITPCQWIACSCRSENVTFIRNIASRSASDAASYSRRTYFPDGHTSNELCEWTWLLEEPMFVPTIREIPTIYGIWNLITVFTMSRNKTLFFIWIHYTLFCHTLCIRVHRIVLFVFATQYNRASNNKKPLTTENQSGYMRQWFLKSCKVPCKATFSVCRSPGSCWVRLDSNCCFWSFTARDHR